jgi:hypothetical protein
MEIDAGEKSCYLLLTFICVMMEVHWRSKFVGKVTKNLSFLKKWHKTISHDEFDCTYNFKQ